jgi:hypothetical protein
LGRALGYPRWRRDSRELYYLAAADRVPAQTLMAAEVDGSREPFVVKRISPLFDLQVPRNRFPYDVAADGRFLVNRALDAEATDVMPTVVLNWPALLNRQPSDAER